MKNKIITTIIITILLATAVQGLTNTIFSDINNDGDLDIFLETLIENIDNGTTFRRLSKTDGIGHIQGVTQGYFINTTNVTGITDNLLYIVREGRTNLLYKNNFDKTFTNITNTALGQLLTGTASDPIGAVFADFNNDNIPDCLVNGVFLLSNGTTFAAINDTNTINKTGLADMPRMKQLIPTDINTDGRTDIIGVTETGIIKVYLNLGDTNSDGIPEFYDATNDMQLNSITQTNFIAAENIQYGIAVNRTIPFYPFSSMTPPFLEDAWTDLYIVREQTTNMLLIQTYPQVLTNYTNATFYIPIFEDLSKISGLDITTNGTAAIIADFDNNNATDILYATNDSGTKLMLRNGSSWELQFILGANINENPRLIQAADLTNNGYLDLAGINREFVYTITGTNNGTDKYYVFTAALTTHNTELFLVESTQGLFGMPYATSDTLIGLNDKDKLITDTIGELTLGETSYYAPQNKGHVEYTNEALSTEQQPIIDPFDPVPPTTPVQTGGGPPTYIGYIQTNESTPEPTFKIEEIEEIIFEEEHPIFVDEEICIPTGNQITILINISSLNMAAIIAQIGIGIPPPKVLEEITGILAQFAEPGPTLFILGPSSELLQIPFSIFNTLTLLPTDPTGFYETLKGIFIKQELKILSQETVKLEPTCEDNICFVDPLEI